MASRPSRTTRSSTAASTSTTTSTTTGPRTRTTRQSALTSPSSVQDPTSTSLPPRRTTRVSRSTTPALESKPPSRPTSRASANPRASSTVPPINKPLWTSNRTNAQVSTPPAPPGAKRTSLAVPKPRTGAGGLLRKMTSRDSMRTPATPVQPARTVTQATPAAVRESSIGTYEGNKEPIKAYLRIRPPPPGVSAESYMQIVGDSDVLMVPPTDHRLNPSCSSSSLFSNALLRSSNLNLNPSSHPQGYPDDVLASSTTGHNTSGPDPSSFGTLYKFTSVFPSSSSASPTSPTFPTGTTTSQSDFFRSTTLPLVKDFLEKGENCLLFAYGPSGSGKTFTVQGGQGDEAGLLPRVMDVVWRSLEGKDSQDVGRKGNAAPMSSTPVGTPVGKKTTLRGLGAKESLPMTDLPEIVSVEEGYDYSIWVSYSEIYNEKIYDLLDSPLPAPAPSTSSTTSTSGHSMFSGFLGAKSLFKFPTVKRSALSLKADKTAAGTNPSGQTIKIVAGMKEIRVHSAEEAQAVLARGQANRRVFSTLANRVSSRSHSIFSIKVHRTPISIDSDSGGSLSPKFERTSKFSIVDLAGSERVVNTQTSGERLKEAGNINKSLMVLGQCMEVLRKNQEREKGRKPAIVPFRHSKLTEMFQSFFIGDGKAVMIVNVNPYETGYDENSHVMKFSAVAKGVMTVKKDQPTLLVPVPPTPSLVEQKKITSEPRVVRVSLAEGAEEEDFIYEEEDVEDDEDEEDEFVNALLDELSSLRSALYESQMATVLAESNARARTVREYEAKMLEMERKYQERIREEAIEAENKLNAKLDILTRLQAAKTPRRVPVSPSEATPSAYDDSDEGEDVFEGGEQDDEEEEEDSRVQEGEGDSGEVEQMLLASHRNDGRDSMSPLAARVKVKLHVNSPSPVERKQSPLAHVSPLEDREEDDVGSDNEGERDEQESNVDNEGIDDQDEEEELNEKTCEEVEMLDSETINTSGLGGDVEGTLGSLADFIASDEEQDDDDEEEDEGSEDDYGADEEREVIPEADDDDQGFASRPPKSRSKQTPNRNAYHEKENMVPTKEDDGPNGDADEFGFDRSLVIQSGSKSKKSKRKLGGKVRDADDLDAVADVLMSPISSFKTPSSRSFNY